MKRFDQSFEIGDIVKLVDNHLAMGLDRIKQFIETVCIDYRGMGEYISGKGQFSCPLLPENDGVYAQPFEEVGRFKRFNRSSRGR